MPSSRPSSRTRHALAVAQQAPLQGIAGRSSNLSKLLTQDREPTKRQRKIAGEAVTRAGSIELTSLLQEWASETIARAHVTTQRHVFQTFHQLNAVAASATDEETAKDMQAWTAAQKAMLVRHEATLLDGAAAGVTALATNALPIAEEDDKPTGILAWLKGG